MFEVNASITGFTKADFDKKKVRKALRKEGNEIRKASRKLISRRVVSLPDQFPGRKTGLLMRSIKVKVSRPGFLVVIRPEKIAGMKDFYPAFLHYGSQKNNLAPRKNFMVSALESRRERSRAAIMHALQDSIIPRK